MDLIPRLIVALQITIAFIVFVILVYLIYRRMNIKKSEDFEQRDN